MNPSNKYYSKDQSIRFVMTTPEEETVLFNYAKGVEKPVKEIAEGCMLLASNPALVGINSPEAAREFLIKNHLLFAMTFAKQVAKGNLPFNEVVSAANFAVVKAFESFDPAFGSRFTTYLRPFINGEIQTLWRSKFNSCDEPDPSISQCQFARLPCSRRGTGANEGDTVRFEVELEEARYGHEDHQGEELNLRNFNREQLGAILAGLPERSQELITLHYFEGLSLVDISRKWGITRMGVSVAHKRLLAQLKKALKKRVEEVV